MAADFQASSAVPQLVRWAVNDGGQAGINVEPAEENFISWERLKPEVEGKLLNQVRVIPVGSIVETGQLYGKKDWIVKILDPTGREIGHVWFGGDPNQNWVWDGIVRVGPVPPTDGTKVWQGFTRYSDGSYRRVENFI